ncbi:minor capsid protein [Capybara microvirus Cap1_SP_259]|nr:minor capsid protein [Capybara microvirus Cap1_SP_259]
MGLFSKIGDLFTDAWHGLSGKDAAQAQNAANLSAWNLTNDYNSPVAQMQRLEAAGLNPNLVYSSGNTTGQASSLSYTGEYSDPFAGLSNIAKVAAATQGIEQGFLTMSKTKADTNASNATAQNLEVQNGKLKAETTTAANNAKVSNVIADSNAQKALAESQKAQNDALISDIQLKNALGDRKYIEKHYQNSPMLASSALNHSVIRLLNNFKGLFPWFSDNPRAYSEGRASIGDGNGD